MILIFLWVLLSYGSGMTSYAQENAGGPLQLLIDYNYMLTNQQAQMAQTPPSFSVFQTAAFPQIVSSNVAPILDESLMIHYASSPPIVPASMTPGIVSPTNNVTAVDSVGSIPELEPISTTVESVEITVILEDTTPTISSITTGSTNYPSTLASISPSTSSTDSFDTSSATAYSSLPSSSSSNSIPTYGSKTSGVNETITPSLDSTSTFSPVDTTSISNRMNSLITHLNASFIGPVVGYVIPAEIKITVNVNSVPAVSVNNDQMASTTSDDTINVEVFEGNNTASLKNDYVESTSETISGTTINIDLSNQNGGSGQFSFTPPQQSVISIKTTSVPAMIYEDKCNQYYDIGMRRTRTVHVHIIGGTYTAQKEFPHMAALGYGTRSTTQWLCGGSLISEEYVITAAHCLSAKNVGDIQFVRLGTTTLQTETLESQDYNVIARIPHPDFVAGKQYDDIALLKLDRPVSFNEFMAPICLAASRDLANAKLIATGWGKMDSGDVSTELQKVDLDYVPRDVCQRGYNAVPLEELPEGIREDSQLCAGAPQGSKDTCQGDSGGPLQMQQDGRMYLIGITSFGIGCGKAESPGVYTRVSYYIPWIVSIVWGQ